VLASDRPALDQVATGWTVSAKAVGIARPTCPMRHRPAPRPRGRPTLPDAQLVADIRSLVAHRQLTAIAASKLCCAGKPKDEREAPNPKRVYRVMTVRSLLLRRDGEHREERRHAGRVAVDLRNTHWGLPTDGRSHPTVARTCVSHSRSTAATVRHWDTLRRQTASQPRTFRTYSLPPSSSATDRRTAYPNRSNGLSITTAATPLAPCAPSLGALH